MNVTSPLFPELFTEKTTSELFADMFGDIVRFDHKRQRFLIWNNHCWVEDKTDAIIRLIMRMSEDLEQQAKESDDKQLRSWAIRLQTHAKITNIRALIQAVKPIPLTGDEFDTSPFLLGVKNGVVNLETGKLQTGKQSDYVSMFAPVSFNEKAESSQWEKFIDSLFEGDTELIHYIQKALGYSITASMNEQLVFICYGEGSNGKSVFFNVINHILGDYAYTASSNMFKKNSFYTNTNDIADIDRKRFLTNAESIKDQTMDEEKIKSISGGDKVTARRLHENNFSFYPVGKIWLYTNNYPRFDDDSYGLWRRIRVIKFPHTFSEAEQIPDLDQKLLEEKEGILSWLVQGCLMWQKERLAPTPESVILATRDYKAENNPLSEYLFDRTIVDEYEKVSSSLLYTDYKLWMADRRKPPLTQNAFGRKMAEFPYEKKREENGNYYYGIKMVQSS